MLCTALAAATSTVRVTPFVLELAIRPPVLVAKQAASLAVLSGNRLSLGVGISPWPEDFALLGLPFERRGKRMDEAVEVVRGLCAGGFFEYHGECYDIPAVELTPTPTEPIPILVGGHSDAALRRAVRLGDGWMQAGGDAEELDRLLRRIRELWSERDNPAPFQIHVVSRDAFDPDGVARLAEAGVTDLVVGFRSTYQPGPDTRTLAEKIDSLNRYADTVIHASQEQEAAR